MSWLSKGLKGLGGGLKTVGKFALPIAGGALLGPGGAALGGALSGALGSGKPKVGNILGGAAGGLMTGGVGGSLLGGIGKQGLLKGVGNFALDNPELLLGGLSAIQGAQQQGKANALQKQALGYATQPWEDMAGVRRMAVDRLQNSDQPPDLSHLYAGSSNPFARPMQPMKTVGRMGRFG
jgi:hypothetical protein